MSVMFADRCAAGSALAAVLVRMRDDGRLPLGPDPVVLGLPRGGVPVAHEVARALGAPLDVIVVRKLGVPSQPELAMGAIGEGGARVIDHDTVRAAGVGADELAEVEERETEELARRIVRFRGHQQPTPIRGRDVIVVDDGIATGSTAMAACRVARAAGAARVILAVPVAPIDWRERLHGCADGFANVATPRRFRGVGQFYDDFGQTSDEEVVAHLAAARAEAAERPAGPNAPGREDDG